MYRLHERLVAIRTEYNLRLKSGSLQPAQVALPLGQRPRQDLEDVTLRYLQDLLAWVEENQRRLNGAEWGVDLPTVESQLGSHRGLHQSIDEFRAKIERARADEVRREGDGQDRQPGPHPGWDVAFQTLPSTCWGRALPKPCHGLCSWGPTPAKAVQPPLGGRRSCPQLALASYPGRSVGP